MKPLDKSLEEQYFLLFACCVSVKGQKRSLIADLQRNKFKYIPNLLYDILELCKKHPLGIVLEMLEHEEDEGIWAYLQALQDEQLGFFTSEPQSFPPLADYYEYPGIIANSIIEYTDESPYDLYAVLDQLQKLRCKLVQIRFFGDFDLHSLYKLRDYLYGSYFYLAEVYLPYSPDMELDLLAEILIGEHRIFPLCIYDCPDDRLAKGIETHTNFVKSRLILTQESFAPGQMEEFISEQDFTVNTEFFVEARKFNTGLHKKVCIDIEGNIKNHLSHRKSFARVQTKELQEIVSQPSFQQSWFINNDLIETCKVCEYRYLCLDNTEIKYEDEKYYKTKLCRYDPFKAEWN